MFKHCTDLNNVHLSGLLLPVSRSERFFNVAFSRAVYCLSYTETKEAFLYESRKVGDREKDRDKNKDKEKDRENGKVQVEGLGEINVNRLSERASQRTVTSTSTSTTPASTPYGKKTKSKLNARKTLFLCSCSCCIVDVLVSVTQLT